MSLPTFLFLLLLLLHFVSHVSAQDKDPLPFTLSIQTTDNLVDKPSSYIIHIKEIDSTIYTMIGNDNDMATTTCNKMSIKTSFDTKNADGEVVAQITLKICNNDETTRDQNKKSTFSIKFTPHGNRDQITSWDTDITADFLFVFEKVHLTGGTEEQPRTMDIKESIVVGSWGEIYGESFLLKAKHVELQSHLDNTQNSIASRIHTDGFGYQANTGPHGLGPGGGQSAWAQTGSSTSNKNNAGASCGGGHGGIGGGCCKNGAEIIPIPGPSGSPSPYRVWNGPCGGVSSGVLNKCFPGRSYGDFRFPTTRGSSGGGLIPHNGAWKGLAGAGGGALHLIAYESIKMATGTEISSNGRSCGDASGGGAGGSVWIETALFEAAASTKVHANGGTGNIEFNGCNTGGGGGGGRISINIKADNFPQNIDVSAMGAGMHVNNGHKCSGNGIQSAQNKCPVGGAGTVFIVDVNRPNGELILDNKGENRYGTGTPAFTPLLLENVPQKQWKNKVTQFISLSSLRLKEVNFQVPGYDFDTCKESGRCDWYWYDTNDCTIY